MRIEHRDVVSLVPRHYFINFCNRGVGVGPGLEQRQRREPDPAPEPHHLQVLYQRVGPVLGLHGGDQVESLAGHHGGL